MKISFSKSPPIALKNFMKRSFFYLTLCFCTVFYIELSSLNKLAGESNQKDRDSQIALNANIDPSIVYPQLTFVYDWRGKFIDILGSLFFNGFKADNNQKNELKEKLPPLIASWNQQAPTIFDEIFSVFRCGFKQKERTAIVSLFGTGGYGSSNFLWLGLRFLLDSEPWDRLGSKENYFTILVFHELLHIWVDDNIAGRSALLTKYKDEHEDTREHIHLMALQKMVYLKLNNFDALETIDHEYRYHSLPSYQRAWEIVNDIEGYEIVIQDILDRLNA